jgi:hypothetical protein
VTATCAACMQPITKATRFVLCGTEALHRACVVNSARSLANRQAQRILELERLLELAQRGTRDAARSCEVYVTRADHAVAAARAEALAAHAAQVAAENTALVAHRACRALTSKLSDVSEARDETVRERDAARSEAALHQALGPAPSAPAAAHAEVAELGKDDTEQRFSMMELD